MSSWNTHCVLVYSLNGEFVYRTGEYGNELGKFDFPYLTDVDRGGKLMMADWSNHRLQVLDTRNRECSEISGPDGLPKVC